ncbi:MAG: FkbM family methyltransferase [Hyphomicrobiaceae bacterium]|nr:FkbM family methyltransferase [Hyphomicrobiaceae bacterium]
MPHFEERNIVFIFSELAIDTIIDIGANAGQFAQKMRSAGFKGRIISFEPVTASHRELCAAARRDPLWTVAPKMAIGASEGSASINVMADTSLSSFLDSTHVDTVASETVRVCRLDDALDELGIEKQAAIAIKIDVQGFEEEVLDGATSALCRAKAILVEVSLRQVYRGEPNYLTLLNRLHSEKWDAAYFSPVLSRRRLGRWYQADVLLIKDWSIRL